jgi:hypothetical protein
MSLATLEVRLPTHLSGTINAEVDVFTSLGLAYTQTFQKTLEITAVADQGSVAADPGRIDLGQHLALRLGYELFDIDGSEKPSLEVQGVPKGMKITDGAQSFVSTNPLTWFDLTQWDVSKLKLITDEGVPGDYFLTYRLTTTETSNGSTASIEKTVYVRVDEVLPQLAERRIEQKIDMPRVIESSDRSVPETEAKFSVSETSKGSDPAPTALAAESLPPAESSAEVTGFIAMEPVILEFDQDLELAREFEALERISAGATAVSGAGNSMNSSIEYRQQDLVYSPVSDSSLALNMPADVGTRADQGGEEAREIQIQEQAEIDREVDRGVSLQGRVVAFWNMLRGGVVVQETVASQDNRTESRTSQRSTKVR